MLLRRCSVYYSLILLCTTGFLLLFFFFFFNDTATTEIYTLSLHDALPISVLLTILMRPPPTSFLYFTSARSGSMTVVSRSEEHTSELQSQSNLVCRLLLEKKKKKYDIHAISTPAPAAHYSYGV